MFVGKGHVKALFKLMRHFQGWVKLVLLCILFAVFTGGVVYKVQGWFARAAIQRDIRLKRGNLASPVVPQVSPSPTPSPSPLPMSHTALPSRYTVRRGDTLSSIAGAQLGSLARWKQLYQLNRRVVGRNPAKILPGTVLQLPRR